MNHATTTAKDENDCEWCEHPGAGGSNTPEELCRTHRAEHAGATPEELDRREAKNRRSVKIRITVVVDVDSEKWDPFATPADLRKDVKSYVLNLVQQSQAMQDAAGEVTLR